MHKNPEALALISTAVLGGMQVDRVREGSRCFKEEKPARGSRHLFEGSVLSFTLSVVNEMLRLGQLTGFTVAQLPFLVTSFTQFIRHNPNLSEEEIYTKFQKLCEEYNEIHAAIINMAVAVGMLLNGVIDLSKESDVLRETSMMGLSVSAAMNVEGKGYVLDSALEERLFTVFATRASLTAVLGNDLIFSVMDAFQQQSFAPVNTLAAMFIILNTLNLMRDSESYIGKRLENKGLTEKTK